MDQEYNYWQDRRDLSSRRLAHEEPAENSEDQAGSASNLRQSGRGRKNNRNHDRSTSTGNTALTSQYQVQDTTDAPAMPTAPTQSQAAATHFWAIATPATLFGFHPNTATRAAGPQRSTRMRPHSEPTAQAAQSQEIHRPVEQSESPFDADMLPARATAIMGAFLERREDVGKERRGWGKERYIDVDWEGQPGRGRERNAVYRSSR